MGPEGRSAEVPDPPREEDRRSHRGGHAPDQLGCRNFGRDVQGHVHWVHQDGHPVDPPRMPAYAAPEELRAASRRSAIGRLVAVPRTRGPDLADRPTMGSMWCHRQVRTSS
jgi:hypothetical protein